MKNIIGIVNYGVAGNTFSVQKALMKAGAETILIKNPSELEKVSKVVLPGVGSFSKAMSELEQGDLISTLKWAIQNKPTLGICLGMQILAELGFENGYTRGLNILSGEVKPIIVKGSVPNMGFRKVEVINSNPLFNRLNGELFYFMHSYEYVNYTNVVALSKYAGHQIVSAVQKEHVYGVQFHPEKSREQGIILLKNFLSI